MFEVGNLPPLPPSPSSSSSSSSRTKLPKMPSSIRIFQEQHVTEFAHLHQDNYENNEERIRMLNIEKQRLEEARRIGRAKRQTLSHHHSSSYNSDSNHRDDSDITIDMGMKSGWRPLSLLARRQPLTKPTDLIVNDRTKQSRLPDNRGTGERQRQMDRQQHSRKSSFRTENESFTPTETDTPDLSSPLQSDVNSPDLALITPNQLELTLGCSTPPPVPTKSKARHVDSGDHSIQSSTYSWASSFSGETVELRAAAHYVPSISEEGGSAEYHVAHDHGEEEILDSPAKTNKRRKRIVAIAHTVRQLEGIGSRDVEDPDIYQQLVKAWNERPGVVQPCEPIWSPPSKAAPAIPSKPNPAENTFDPYLAPPDWLAPPSLSPGIAPYMGSSPVPSSNLEHHTPNLDDESERFSDESHTSSNPFRYSYASTLHDLALEGGLQHGTKLMSEKAWLKSPLFDQGTYFDAQTLSGPLPVGTFSEPQAIPMPGGSPSKSSVNESESDCIPSPGQPERTLRRHNRDIGSLHDKKLGTPIDLGNPNAGPSSTPTNWGLGFLGNWLKDELKDESVEEEVIKEEGFQYGEDGTSPIQTNTREKISSFLAEGDVIAQQPLQHQSPRTSDTIDPHHPFEAKKAIDTNEMQLHPNSIVLPPPLPTPEVELLIQQIPGLTKSQINPSPPKECITLAKEYQFSNPCRRQSYSTPSDILYPHPHHPHQDHPLASTTQLQNNQIGVGDLQVELEMETELQNRDQEESWDSSAISSYRYQTPPLRLSHHGKSPSPSHSTKKSSVQHPDLPPLPSTVPEMNPIATPPRTPKSHLRPILPPLPPTPKYRRPTPPLLTNSNFPLHRENGNSRNIDESEIVGVGSQIPRPQNYDHSCYWGSTVHDIDSQIDTPGFGREHPSYPYASSTNQVDISVSSDIQTLPQAVTTETDMEKAIPSRSSSNKHSRTPLILFILGFVMPILWFVGGWPILRPSPHTETTQGEETSLRRFRWIDHPDRMVRACRWAAIISIPTMIIAGVIAAVVVVVAVH
ncbi:uncharacterized protein IL334_007463 [Kwoniella shivajii]|uniref:Uncharacterized protein n=1 Tax=Kwoniella shivajii TaxID=564305 RepID=A0ABZ1D8R0_9TREE|nr:hypothetical protein IL334_007463 [Kwoniella shivajii]